MLHSSVFRSVGVPLRFRLYPSGEFSATKVKETPSLVSEEPLDSFDESMRWSESSYAKGQVSDSLRAKLIASTLGSSNVPNSHKSVKARGRKGLTRYNKRLIVNSVLLLEKKYGKGTLSFLTLTLPPECASGSSDLYAECKRQMLQWLQRSLARCGLPVLVIGCTEIQSSRLNDTGQFALHEHWVFKGREAYGGWALQPKAFAEAWLRILANVYELGATPVSSSAATRVESIKKSAAAYLGKYVSKGEKCVAQLIEGGYEEFLPHSWVTKTAAMLAMFRASIITMTGEKVREIMETLQDNASIFCRWSRNLKIELASGFECWLGFIGYLSPDGWRFVRMASD